ncbi:hypothetical protein LP419_30560 [Massilia sp. H-1]|nr:hypothetical protein LP419_30560 [Massilia sp. H-1]
MRKAFPWCPCAQLERDQGQLFAQDGTGQADLTGHARQCRIDPETGFDADRHQVERVGEAFEDLVLAAADRVPEQQIRQIGAEGGRQQQVQQQGMGVAAVAFAAHEKVHEHRQQQRQDGLGHEEDGLGAAGWR